MKFDDRVSRHTRGAMQIVDILGDDVTDLAGMIEPGDDLVAASRLRMRDGIINHEITAPGLEPCFFGGEIGTEFDGLVSCPESSRRAEIRNAAFGRNAGTREDDRALGGLDHFDKLVYVISHCQSASKGRLSVKYLHTMIRVSNLDQSLDFFIKKLGFVEQRRYENEKGRFTLVFVAAPESPDAPVELTYNWDPEAYSGGRNFGHLAIEVDNVYSYCEKLQKQGVTINRPPRDGRMAFIKTPDGISIEILNKDGALPIAEPWASMQNTGSW